MSPGQILAMLKDPVVHAVRLENGSPPMIRRGAEMTPFPPGGTPTYADLQALCKSLLDKKQLAELLKNREFRLVREAPGVGKIELVIRVSPSACSLEFARLVESAVELPSPAAPGGDPHPAPAATAPPIDPVSGSPDPSADSKVSDQGHCRECRATLIPGFELCPVCGAAQPAAKPLAAIGPAPDPAGTPGVARNRVHAAILAFVIGPTGAHELYVGRHRRGAIFLGLLIFSAGHLGVLLWLIAGIQGISFLAGTDRDFDRILGKATPDADPAGEQKASRVSSPRRIEVATALAFIFGPLGAHAFYMGCHVEGAVMACLYMGLGPLVLSRPEIQGYALLFWMPALTRVLHWWTCLGRAGFERRHGDGGDPDAPGAAAPWTALDVALHAIAIAIALGLVGQTMNSKPPPAGLSSRATAGP